MHPWLLYARQSSWAFFLSPQEMIFNFCSEIIFKQFQEGACYASVKVPVKTSKRVWPVQWGTFPHHHTKLSGTGPSFHSPPRAQVLIATRHFEIKNVSSKAHKSRLLQTKDDIIFSLLFSILPSLSFFVFKHFATSWVLERGSKPNQCQGGSIHGSSWKSTVCGWQCFLIWTQFWEIFGMSVETVFRNQFDFHLWYPLSLPENDV